MSGSVLLDVQGYAADAAFSSLVAHAIPRMERVDLERSRYSVLVRTADGPVEVEVTLADGRAVVRAEVSAGCAAALSTAVSSWLDLGTDVAAVEDHLCRDPQLRPLVESRPGLRILGAFDGFAAAVMTVVGQQVSLAATRTFGARLVAGWGRPDPQSGLSEFPTAATLAAADPADVQEAVGITGSRARTIAALARACASGLVLAPGQDLAETREALLAVPGIGPWTADYVAWRALRDPDALPAGDLVLRRALGVTTSREVVDRAVPWSPYRAYAVAHWWHHVAYSRSPGGRPAVPPAGLEPAT